MPGPGAVRALVLKTPGERWASHLNFFLLLIFFPPATIAAVLVYIVLRGLHALAFGPDREGLREGVKDEHGKLSARLRRGCTFAAIGIWLILAVAQIVLTVGALVTGGPIV